MTGNATIAALWCALAMTAADPAAAISGNHKESEMPAASLENDINQGLALVMANAGPNTVLDAHGEFVIPVPIPPGVATLPDKRLLIAVRLSRTRKQFSLHATLGHFRSLPDAASLEALLQRNHYAEPNAGVVYSISPSDNALVATCHWPFGRITPEQFSMLVTKFSLGVLRMLRETHEMSRGTSELVPLATG